MSWAYCPTMELFSWPLEDAALRHLTFQAPPARPKALKASWYCHLSPGVISGQGRGIVPIRQRWTFLVRVLEIVFGFKSEMGQEGLSGPTSGFLEKGGCGESSVA